METEKFQFNVNGLSVSITYVSAGRPVTYTLRFNKKNLNRLVDLLDAGCQTDRDLNKMPIPYTLTNNHVSLSRWDDDTLVLAFYNGVHGSGSLMISPSEAREMAGHICASLR